MITADKTINGRAYKLVKLPPLEAGEMATCVAQILAGAASEIDLLKALASTVSENLPSLKQAVEGGADKVALGVKMLEDAPALLSALAGGVAKVDAKALYALGLRCIRGQLFATTKLVDDRALNAYFSEYPEDLLLVMVWAIQVNCAGFFGLRVLA